MTAPTNLSVQFVDASGNVLDNPTFNPGDAITAKITWQSGEQVETSGFTLTVVVQNQNSESTNITATFSVNKSAPEDTFTVQATDDGDRTWNVEVGSDGMSATATTNA
jgi:hypothetical protein